MLFFIVWLPDYSNKVAIFTGAKNDGESPSLYKIAGDSDVSIFASNFQGTVTLKVSGVSQQIDGYNSIVLYKK